MRDFTELVDLAAERLGGRVLAANDDFFAPKENLLKASKPVFIEGKYTSRGKWMDGWESRRRRTPGHDWCVIRLGLPGIIRGFVVDTSFFKGNYPERCSIEACALPAQSAKAELKTLLDPETRWIELLSESQLKGDSHNLFAIGNPGRFTHLRLRIFPDGGVARLRVHGQVVPAPLGRVAKPIDLVAIENGGSVVSSSDQFFGTPLNMLMPGTSLNMGDGWETRRRRGPGYDWAIVKLGMPGRIERAEVNTAHFKGNFPDSCSIEVLNAPETSGSSDNGIAEADSWTTLLPQTKLKAHHRHFFTRELRDAGVATHVRLNIYPDGGVGRLRLYGVPELASDPIARFNAMPRMAARKALLDCCGSRKWVAKMLAGRPFESLGSILKMADEIWAALKPSDWLEAFRHHPPIGGKKAKAAQSSAAKRWSSGEQSAAQQSSDATLRELAEGNVKYHEKFGHVFLICATGRSGDEILAALRRRIENDAKTELHIAAEEQRQITRLRLEKLLR